MPCGGIFPVDPKEAGRHSCFHCHKLGCDHFLIEWDSFLHKGCVRPFLETEEGIIVVRHGHLIQVGDTVLQKEIEEGLRLDPDVCLQKLREMLNALALGALPPDEHEELLDRFNALDDWLKRGGFLPKDWRC